MKKACIIITVLFAFFTASCKTTSKNYPFYLDIQRLNRVNNVAIYIEQSSTSLEVFDPTGIKSDKAIWDYYHPQTTQSLNVALVTPLVEVMTKQLISNILFSYYKDKNISQLNETISSAEVDRIFRVYIKEELVNSKKSNINFVFINDPETVQSEDKFRSFIDDNQIELFVGLNYVYGLGIQKKLNPMAMIEGSLTVLDMRDGEIIVYRGITSGFFYTGLKVNEYLADGGKLYYEEMVESSRRVGQTLASTFHLD